MSTQLAQVKKQVVNPNSNFSYIQPRSNYPVFDIRKIEKVLIPAFVEIGDDKNLILSSKTESEKKQKAKLPLTSDFGNVGYKEMLYTRGALRELQYA